MNKNLMKNILIIEDDESIRLNAKDILEFHGFQVMIAGDGLEGIKIASKFNFDLIVCDIMMPKMNGYEVKNQLQKNERLKHTPFVFLSAKTELADIRYGMELGADDYILKPFTLPDFVKVIKGRLERIEELRDSSIMRKDAKTYQADDKILLEINNSPEFLRIGDIMQIQVDDDYSKVFTVNNKTALLRKPLKEWEKILPENKFIRVHRSNIVNIDYIQKIEKWFRRSYRLYLKNNREPIIVSERYAVKLKSKLSV